MKCTPASHFAAFSFIALSIGLSACEQRSPWHFDQRDADFREVLHVSKVEYRNSAELTAAAAQQRQPDGSRLNLETEEIEMFGRLQPDRSRLEIHFVRPESNPDFECDLGHELAHGFYGNWHTKPGS